MNSLPPEVVVVIVSGVISVAATLLGAVSYVLKRQKDAELERQRQATAKAQSDAARATAQAQMEAAKAEQERAAVEFPNRVLSVLENTLAQFAQEREDAKHDTQRFAAIMETNATSKNALTAAVSATNDRLTTMTTSIDDNTNVLRANTQTVGTHSARVGSFEQGLNDFKDEMRRELQTIVDAVRDGLSDERMTPLIERVVQTAIDRVKEAPDVPPAPPALVPKGEPESETEDKSA